MMRATNATGTQAFTSVDTDVADTSGIYSLLASLGGDTIRINAPGDNPIVEPKLSAGRREL